MKSHIALRPTLIVIISMIVALIIFGDFGKQSRQLIVLPYMLVFPGLAWIPLLHLDEPLAIFTLSIAFSLAMLTLVAIVMVYTNTWSPSVGAIIVLSITIIGALLQIYLGLTTRE